MGLKPRNGKPALTPEMLERFRRTGIRLDREGRFWHEGAVVEHRGFHQALLRWLDTLADGRPILRLDDTRYAYVDVDDAHLLGTSIEWRGDRAMLTTNDGATEELDYASLAVGDGDALYARVRGGALEARLTTPAYYALAEHIDQRGDEFVLRAGSREFVIGVRQRQPQAEAGTTQG